MRLSAWLSVHLVASDVVTSGVAPQFAAFSLNLPEELDESQKSEYVASLGDSCEKLGISIVSGHTGTYPGSSFTIVGGGTMFAFTRAGEYVHPGMAKVGDRVLMTKGAAVEAAASLAWAFPKTTRERVGNKVAELGLRLLDSCTVVRDATVARSIGLGKEGVTTMHDATEGGVLGGLAEMAGAASKAFVVDPASIMVSEEANAICGAYGIDPLTSLSEGTLLVTCAPPRVDDLKARFSFSGIPVAEIGVVKEGVGVWLFRRGGSPQRLRPTPDGYWQAYRSGTLSRLE
jgi:hydrogenase maturation factor